MKNYIKNLLKASLIMLAVVAAFAFTTPFNPQDRIFAFDRDAEEWVEITGLQVGVNYECDPDPEICSARLVNDDPLLGEPIPDTESFGVYSPLVP